jgi:hypothetical protein
MGIISLSISVVVLASVFIATVKNTSTTSWSTSEVTMWGLLSLIAIVGLLFGVMNVFGIA